MHAIVMVHKMQRLALSTNQLLPEKPAAAATKPVSEHPDGGGGGGGGGINKTILGSKGDGHIATEEIGQS